MENLVNSLRNFMARFMRDIDNVVNYTLPDMCTTHKSSPLFCVVPEIGQKYSLKKIYDRIHRTLLSRIPNSISKIEEFLTDMNSSRKWGVLTIKGDSYFVNRFSIFKITENLKVEPCMFLVTDSSIISKIIKEEFNLDWSNIFTEIDYFSGEVRLKNLSLIVSKKFIESDSGKSLYNRLNKNFLPSLLENNVEIKIVSKDYILKNVFNPFQRKFTPLEQRSFEKMVIQEVEKMCLE